MVTNCDLMIKKIAADALKYRFITHVASEMTHQEMACCR